VNTIFITGNSGFIGHALSKYLIQNNFSVFGYDLCPCTINDVQHTIGDINDYETLNYALKMCNPDYVIHLAARCDLNGLSLDEYKTNTMGVKNLCKIISSLKSVRRVIFTSSQLVCKIGYIPRDHYDFYPNTPYGKSKVLTESIVREEDGGKTQWCIVRPTTVWGPNMSNHYQNFLGLIKKRKFFHSGKGDLFKSYSYIDNITYQYFKFLSAKSEDVNKKVFYFADYTPLSLREYVNNLASYFEVKQPYTLPLCVCYILAFIGTIFSKLGINSSYNLFRLKNIRTEYVYDLTETQKICGPLPFTIRKGIKKTVVWYNNLEKNF